MLNAKSVTRRDFLKTAAFCSVACGALFGTERALAEDGTGMYITDGMTVGDVMRMTDPETYGMLSNDVRETFDSMPYGTVQDMSYTSKSRALKVVYGVGALHCSSPEPGTISYSATYTTNVVCPATSMQCLVTRLSDGEVVVNHLAFGSYDNPIELHGSKTGLSSGRYRIALTTTIVRPPAGDYILDSGPGYTYIDKDVA